MSVKYKGKKLLPLVATALCALLFCGCNDDFENKDTAGEMLRFDIVVSEGWSDGRNEAGNDSRCTSITTLDSDFGTSLYLHCDETSAWGDTARNSRGALQTGIGNFSLSAICYTGTYPADEESNNWTPDFAHNLIYTSKGIPVDGEQLQWPASGRVRFFAFSPTVDDSKIASNPSISISESSHSGTPFITYTVPADVKSQIDLMAACTDATASNVSLNFRHILTAVKVVSAADMWPGKITKVKFSGIYGRGTYTFAPDAADEPGGKWSFVGDATAEYELTRNVTLSPDKGDLTHTVEGTEIAGETDNCSFVLLPQTLPAGAKLEVTFVDDLTGTEHNMSASLAGKQWAPGKIVTYSLSQTSIKVEYKFEIDKVASDTIPYSGYFKNVAIKAYAAVTEADKTLKVMNLPFKLECSANTSKEWNAVDSVKISSAAVDASSGISTAVYNLCITPQSQFSELRSKFTTITENGKGTEAEPYLLTNDTEGETANTYLVHDHGYYSLPLVYGNARSKGSGNNIAAYKPSLTAEEAKSNLSNFVDHKDEPIVSPEIYNKYTPERAALVWQDAPELVTDVKLTSDGHQLQFKVDKRTMTQGNAVVAVIGDGGQIMWSWQIWVTPYDWSGKADNRIQSKATDIIYSLAPCNLGYCDRHAGDAVRNIHLKCIFDNSVITGKTTSPSVELAYALVQDGIVESYAGDNTYYQWGRKDPSVGGVYNASTIAADPNYHYDMQEKKSFDGEYKFGAAQGRVTFGQSIREPHHHFMGSARFAYGTGVAATDYRSTWWWDNRAGAIFPLTSASSTTLHPSLYNLWDTGLTVGISNKKNPLREELTDEEAAKWVELEKHHCKSVYDPCPAGYHVPTTHIYSYFVKEGATDHNISSVDIIPDVLSHFKERIMHGAEPIGDKFQDLDGKEIAIYLTGLRDMGYPASERPSSYDDIYTIPAHRMVTFIASTNSHSNRPKSNACQIFYLDRRPSSHSIHLNAGSNNAYGFAIRPVRD